MKYEEVKRAFEESNFWKKETNGRYVYTAGKYAHEYMDITISFQYEEYIYILIDLPRVTVRKQMTAKDFTRDGGFLRAEGFEFYIGIEQGC